MGISGNPDRRLAQLQNASAYKLAMVGTFPIPTREIAREVERAFHTTQARRRMSGEWFDMSVAEAVHLMCINIRTMLKYVTDLQGDDLELARLETTH